MSKLRKQPASFIDSNRSLSCLSDVAARGVRPRCGATGIDVAGPGNCSPRGRGTENKPNGDSNPMKSDWGFHSCKYTEKAEGNATRLWQKFGGGPISQNSLSSCQPCLRVLITPVFRSILRRDLLRLLSPTSERQLRTDRPSPSQPAPPPSSPTTKTTPGGRRNPAVCC